MIFALGFTRIFLGGTRWIHSGSCNINIVQQKSSISGLKTSSASIEECEANIEENLGNLVKTKVENELCESDCDVEIAAKCDGNNVAARRRRGAKKLFDVTLEIIVKQESEPEIGSISDKNEPMSGNSLNSLIDTESILKATMTIIEEIENEDGDSKIVEVSEDVSISSEPIEEISSSVDPVLVYQEVEEPAEEEKSSDGETDQEDEDKDKSVDQNLLLKLQTENDELKIQLTLVEESFDEMKLNYDSIK